MSIRKTFSRLLLMVLGAWGFTGCDSTSDPQPTPEYACPYADYSLKGTVLDADSSKAIEGIRIRFNNLTAYSDTAGNWQIAGRPWSCSPPESLYAVDVDGESNRGAFLPDSLLLSPRLIPPLGPHDKWYRGCFVQRDIIITLKKTP